MAKEQNQQEATEKVEMYIRGGREVRQYTNMETGTVRFEGFTIFVQEIKDPATGMVVAHKNHPADYDIEAADYNEALDKFDKVSEETLQKIAAATPDPVGPRIMPAQAGADKLIGIHG